MPKVLQLLLVVVLIHLLHRSVLVTGQDAYLQLRNDRISNNSAILLSDIGAFSIRRTETNNALQCRTPLTECCRGTQTPEGVGGLGWWFFPDGSVVPGVGTAPNGPRIEMIRQQSSVHLDRRNDPTSPTGLYRCVIPVSLTANPVSISANQTLYVSIVTGIPCPDNSNICVDGATCETGNMCTCPPGFTGDGRVRGTGCTDIDECEGSHDCVNDATCVNSVGSFTCTCPSGFTSTGDGRQSPGTGCTGMTITSSGNNTAGEHYQLICTVTITGVMINLPIISFAWWSVPSNDGSNRRVTNWMLNNNSHASIQTFNPLQSSHEGNYTCQVTVGSVTEMRSIQVNVEEPPITAMVRASGTPTVGQSYSLSCTVTGADRLNPTITFQWFKDNTELLDAKQSTLSFSSLSLSDAGQYRCGVTVSSTLLRQPIIASSDVHNLILSIPPPNVTISVPSGPLYAGTNVTLTCTITLSDDVDTDVMMEVTWLRSAAPLSNTTSRVTISPLAESGKTFTSNLTLSPLSLEDIRFACQAVARAKDQSHFAYSDTGMFVVTNPVEAPPPHMIVILVNGSSTAGSPHSLTCIVSVVENLIQPPTVMWTGPGVGETGVEVTGPMVSGAMTTLTLSFNPLRTSHGGQYTCRAVLDIPDAGVTANGMTSRDIIVQIPQPILHITLSPEPIDGKHFTGMDLILSCTIELSDAVDTNMNVSSSWSKNGSPVMSDGRVTVSGTEMITPLKYRTTIMFYSLRDDEGQYTCRVDVTSSDQSVIGITAMKSQHITIPIQLIFQGVSYPNNSVLSINDIGEYSTGSSILCTTNRSPCCSHPSDPNLRFGEWYYPNATQVLILTMSKAVGQNFYRGRTSNQTIHLNRRSNAQSPTGSFCCELPDNSDVTHRLCVELVGVSLTPSGTNTAGEQYRLTCTVSGSTDTPTITWLGPPSGGSLPSGVGDTRMVSDVMSSGSTHTSILQFDPLQSSHEGMYTCQVTVGTVTEKRFRLLNMVQKPPITATVSASGTPTVGQSYLLTCIVTGADQLNPTITYQWLKDNTVVSGETQSTLSFSSISLSDAGQYRCDVTVNSILLSQPISAMSNTQDLILQIPFPSDVTITFTPNGTLFAHVYLTLTCTIELSEAVDIPISVNTLLSGPSGQLFPSVARKTSDGTYTSSATFSSALSNSGEFSCETDISSTHPQIQTSNMTTYTSRVQDVIQTFQLKLLHTDYCITWNSNKVDEVRENIHEQLHGAIFSRSQYQLPGENLLAGVFLCLTKHDQTTYRSTVIGTQSYNATELVGFIQDWVNSGPFVFIQWYAALLDPKCPVSISSLADPDLC